MLIATMTHPTKHQLGRSALSLAAERDHVDVMKDLIERGADVNTQNKVIMYRSRTLHLHSDHACGHVQSLHTYIHIYI